MEPTTYLLDLLKAHFTDYKVTWHSPTDTNTNGLFIDVMEINTYISDQVRGTVYASRSILDIHMYSRTPMTFLSEMVRFLEYLLDKKGITAKPTQWVATNSPEYFHTVTTVFLNDI